MSTQPRIVILGSGYAGASCAREIQKKLGNHVDLTVVERRSCSIHKMASARAATVGNSFSERVLVPNDRLLSPGLGKMVNEKILQVTDTEVRCSNNVVLPFDYLVCATGAKNFSIAEPPLKYADKGGMMKFYDRTSKKIGKADRIVIVGGGSVGVEMAGEIKYEYPGKIVSIVHAGQTLLSNTYPPPSSGFFESITSKVRKMGIDVYLGQKLVLPETNQVKPYINGTHEYFTDHGQAITADLVLVCIGKGISNKFYPDNWKDKQNGLLQVKSTLQLWTNNNIFAIGDLNDVKENKQGYFAEVQGKVAARNIKKLIQGKEPGVYTPGLFGIKRSFVFVSIGREKGVSYLGFLSLGSFFTRPIKSRNMFTKDFWKLFRLGKSLPAEIGGPSKGGKHTLATPDKIENFKPVDKRLAQMRNLTKEEQRMSIQSIATLASAFEDDEDGLELKVADKPQKPSQPAIFNKLHGGPIQINREDVISFQGAAVRGESVNLAAFKEKANKVNKVPGTPTMFKPMTAAELKSAKSKSSSRMQLSGSSSVSGEDLNSSRKEHNAPNNPVSKFQLTTNKVNRNDVVSFVGAKDGRGESVNLSKLQKMRSFDGAPPSSPALFAPMTGDELNRSRKDINKRTTRNGPSNGQPNLIPLGEIALPVQDLNERDTEEDDW